MKYLILSILAFSCSTLAVEEKCPLNDLVNYKELECHFYLGTQAYRSEIYNVALAHWKYVIDSPAEHEVDKQLKATALSTTTYLRYYGLGVKQDRDKAVELWIKAANKGDFEARIHLGYAYSDNNYRNKDLIKSFAWYRSIFLLYPLINDISDVDDIAVDYEDAYVKAKKSLEKLKRKLSQKEQDTALKYAKVLAKKV